MKSTFKFALLTLLFASSIHLTQAKPFYKMKRFSQAGDSLKVHQDTLAVTVFVSFIVDKKGKVGSVEISKTEGDSCSVQVIENCKTEALRTVKTMPAWTPAVENGRRVAVSYNLPIRFKLPREECIVDKKK